MGRFTIVFTFLLASFLVRFGFALGWGAATLPALIGWELPDEFEAARRKSQASGFH
jgi:hypothetical protein